MTQNKGRIVIVDDDHEMREMLCEYLQSIGYEVIGYELASRAFSDFSKGMVGLGLAANTVNAIITDLNMPEMDGIEFIQRIKKLDENLPIVMITAYGTIDSAIEATKVGAFSYVVKPFKLNEFELTLSRALSHGKLKRENAVLRKQIKKGWSYDNIIGKSKAMRDVLSLVDRVSSASANVLITGESGTGKEVIANAIHNNGNRKDKPFVAVNCSAIPETLLESELFGHVKGSFTGAYSDKIGLFEEANEGTLFLDEIGDLDLALQAKLLRVLQEKTIKPVGSSKSKKVNVRIVAATHKDLKKAIHQGSFREDLFYRLCVIPLDIPSLRSRREDIPLLADHFLSKYAVLNEAKVKGFTPNAIKKLASHRWDGNVRELENLVERLVVLCPYNFIDDKDISLQVNSSADEFYTNSVTDWPSLEALEKRYIVAVLEKVGGKKEKAAQILGINRRTLYRKEKEYSGGFPEALKGAEPQYYA